MKILALEKKLPGASGHALTDEILAEEAASVWQLHQSGVIREIYFRAGRDEAVLVLECADIDEARTVLGSLPLVRGRRIDFEIIPLRAYPGFSRLFRDR